MRTSLWLIILLLTLPNVFALPTLAEEPYRPDANQFPLADQAKSYEGQIVFVDHVNRRGSIRFKGGELFHSTAPKAFALLPYGIVRYHGAPADLRDIPLGTMLHGRFYLPPDPKWSVVPEVQRVGPTNPAENHAVLLEDELSYCLRKGKVWSLQEIEMRNQRGIITVTRHAKDGEGNKEEAQQMSIDRATRIWRGRELLNISDLIAEGVWLAEGKQSLNEQQVYLEISWKPAGTWERRVGNRKHISDIWLDETAIERATERQTKVHQELIRSRWMPGWVDAIEYGQFGEATITVTLFGGMDSTLYADFKQGGQAQIAASDRQLKHMDGWVSHSHMAIRGPLVEVTKQDGEVPLGSSGIQVRIEVDLALEGFRPGNIVRIRPTNWPDDAVPREEYTGGREEERFPSPDIFPNY